MTCDVTRDIQHKETSILDISGNISTKLKLIASVKLVRCNYAMCRVYPYPVFVLLVGQRMSAFSQQGLR